LKLNLQKWKAVMTKTSFCKPLLGTVINRSLPFIQ
jgi:hypothetical protein